MSERYYLYLNNPSAGHELYCGHEMFFTRDGKNTWCYLNNLKPGSSTGVDMKRLILYKLKRDIVFRTNQHWKQILPIIGLPRLRMANSKKQ